MKHRAAFVLWLFAALASAGWESNFAENPSAEADRNRDGLPDGWEGRAFKSPAKLSWDKAVAHTGKASLRIQDSFNPQGKEWNEHSGRWYSKKRRPVTPGAEYTIEVWVKTQGVTGSASACIAWFSERKWLAESYTKGIRGTTDWQKLTKTAPAPANAAYALVYLCLSQSKGTAWFDDISASRGGKPPRNFQPLYIAAACTTGFRDDTPGDGKGGWTDQGDNDMRNLPTGDVRLRSIPFRIVHPARNHAKSCIVLKGTGRQTAPTSVTMAVGRTCETVYFLHACAWAPKGARAGHYDIAYADGSTHRVPLVSDREITDWWRPRDTRECAVGWEGANAKSGAVGLNIFPWANAKPTVAIRSIRFVSAGTGPVPMLVAVTTADGPAVLTDLPICYEFTDTAGWYPFTFGLDDTNRDSIDLTGLLDAPAGRHGFVSVRPDGHFYFADGTRARFFGTNIGGPSAFPEKADAPRIAARLAKYGVNLLRIHAIDGRWGKLIDYKRGDSRHFVPEMLDRMDFFVAELRKRGIYVYFDMLDYRRFLPADGVADADKFRHGWHHSIKGATIFNDRLIELQKEFATAFFTHRNPYTGLRYTEDPAVAVVEITNENSVFYLRNTTLTLPVYITELKARWNQWLAQRHGTRAALAKAWTNAKGECALLPDEDPAKGSVVLPMKHLYQDPATAPFVGERSPVRVNAMTRFFFDIERRYYGKIRSHLHKIGIRVPITGTNQTFCAASVYADSVNDFMSRNNYWCHPSVRAKPFFTFRNRTVLNSDIAATSNPITNIASSTVVGKPMISPEFNWPWPIQYRAECLPMMAAYACLQDWDGLLFFAYRPTGSKLEWFASQSDPVRWGTFAAAALLFHRNDVAVAKNTIHVGWSEAEAFTGRRSHREARRSAFRHLTYISKVRNAFFKDKYEGRARLVRGATFVPPNAKRLDSDTGELSLDSDRHLFTIDTARTKAAVGFLGALGKIELGSVTMECTTEFAAVLVTSLDGKPIGQSRRLLLTAVARAENTGQAYTRNHTSVPERGREPVLVEPVAARITVRVPGKATVHTLDPTGKRKATLPATFAQGTLDIRLDQAHSPWCEIQVQNP